MTVFKFRNLKNGQATPIPQGEFTVGRADDTYIHLDDASVSRRHAMILNQEAGLFIEDLGSANGTAAHGAYLSQRVQIDLGDVVYFGSVPFRVDPEVTGEAETTPPAGHRKATRPYMRRETERLPTREAVLNPAEALSSEALSAPEVNPETDMDAGNLNAITMREPAAQPSAPAVNTQVAAPRNHAPQAVAIPVPQPAAKSSPQVAPVASESSFSDDQTNWQWMLVSFLAGLGTGLLLALYFAKLFIELGGKASSLP